MNAELFQITAEQILNDLPARFRQLMQNVVVVIEDCASQQLLDAMNIPSSDQLLGLYEGAPVTERSVVESGQLPDMIYLFRLPILATQIESGESIETCIYDVLIHEIGHHFGFSDAQMDGYEHERKRGESL